MRSIRRLGCLDFQKLIKGVNNMNSQNRYIHELIYKKLNKPKKVKIIGKHRGKNLKTMDEIKNQVNPRYNLNFYI